MGDIFKVLGMIAMIWTYGTFTKASNEYQTQKDAAQVQAEMIARGNIERYLAGGELDKATRQDLHRVLGVYKMVWRQRQAMVIPSSYADQVGKDFCEFAERPEVAKAWVVMRDSGQIGETHDAMLQGWCGITRY